MLGLLLPLLAAAATPADPQAATPSDTPTPAPAPRHKRKVEEPVYVPGAARDIVMAQLQSPPRTDGSGGLLPAEADAIMAHAISNIGRPLNMGNTQSSGSSSTGSHP